MSRFYVDYWIHSIDIEMWLNQHKFSFVKQETTFMSATSRATALLCSTKRASSSVASAAKRSHVSQMESISPMQVTFWLATATEIGSMSPVTVVTVCYSPSSNVLMSRWVECCTTTFLLFTSNLVMSFKWTTQNTFFSYTDLNLKLTSPLTLGISLLWIENYKRGLHSDISQK